MKNGTVQSRVKINEGEQYIVNLSKSRRISMVWLYYLISERTCCDFRKYFRNEQCPARSALFVLSHVCLLKFSEKFQSGGGVFFNPKIYLADFGNFTPGFLKSNWNFTQPPPLRMVSISGNHVHAYHTIWLSYLLTYIQPYPL